MQYIVMLPKVLSSGLSVCVVGNICESHNDIVCFLQILALIAIHDGWTKGLSNMSCECCVRQRRMFVIVCGGYSNCFATKGELFVT